ncbi:MAG: UDP-glucose 4-epimerase [Candidatus Saganbacteria bacterium]|uniref:UDP-glucose 4-epimerase n=1 Tax=Candidatus Saganbacteria bacterium TaxID=2575572 RepID=A0A833P3N4_UNCSA|nr:MAG: UDP-glucose 4-epimerase [Candidatus Saganbacteria bacterium]
MEGKEKKMKILITGGGGFIGSVLLIGLHDKYEIISLDRDQGPRQTKLQALTKDKITFVNGDIRDEVLLDNLMQKGIDVVIHFAGGGGNNACMKDPALAVTSYVHGTHLLLKKSLKYNIKRFIFSSSQAAYSTFKAREMPLTEDMELMPDDLYGALKAVAEHEIRDSQLKFTTLRFANVYGYVQGFNEIRKGGAIENFIKAAYDGSDITIFGKGEQKIDYVNVNDVLHCIEIILNDLSAGSDIFNIGSGKLVSIMDIAKTAAEIGREVFGHQINIKTVPAPEGKIWPDRLISIDKANRLLKWKPLVSLSDGIKQIMTNAEAPEK